MDDPAIVLGVELMDADHLRIEKMFESGSRVADADLPALYRDIATELAAHFAREEELMQKHQFPGLHCHVAQHNVLITEMTQDKCLTSGGAELRRRLQVVMPQLILSHVATMDRTAAAFLKGELGQADFDRLRLRLPVPESAK